MFRRENVYVWKLINDSKKDSTTPRKIGPEIGTVKDLDKTVEFGDRETFMNRESNPCIKRSSTTRWYVSKEVVRHVVNKSFPKISCNWIYLILFKLNKL